MNSLHKYMGGSAKLQITNKIYQILMWRLKGGVENGKGFDTHANCLGAGFLFAG